ncbi:unnamed protein product, partial [Musa banksii]
SYVIAALNANFYRKETKNVYYNQILYFSIRITEAADDKNYSYGLQSDHHRRRQSVDQPCSIPSSDESVSSTPRPWAYGGACGRPKLAPSRNSCHRWSTDARYVWRRNDRFSGACGSSGGRRALGTSGIGDCTSCTRRHRPPPSAHCGSSPSSPRRRATAAALHRLRRLLDSSCIGMEMIELCTQTCIVSTSRDIYVYID